MILQALVQYYEALLARGEIDRPGWSKVNVSWRLDLNPDGSLFDVSPLQKPSPNGKKMLPQQLCMVRVVLTVLSWLPLKKVRTVMHVYL